MITILTIFFSVISIIIGLYTYKKSRKKIIIVITIIFGLVWLYYNREQIKVEFCNEYGIACQNRVEKEGNELLKDAKKYLENNQFNLALKKLDQIPNGFSKKDEVDNLRNKIIRSETNFHIEEIEKLEFAGNYVEIIDYINELSDEQKDTAEITNKLKIAQNYYVEELLNNAKSIFENDGYKNAIDYLQPYSDLYESKKIDDAIAYYGSFAPVALSALEPFYSDSSTYKAGFYTKDLNKDNLGQEHKDVIGGSWENKYNIEDKQYQYIEGVLYYVETAKGYSGKELFNTKGSLSIYNDEQLIDSFKIQPGDKPISFKVNISNVSTLKIVFDGSDMTLSGTTKFAELAGVQLHK